MALAQIQQLTGDTAIPLWIAVGIGLFVVTLCVRISVQLNSLASRLESLETGSNETWTRQHQKVFALDLQARNSNLDVPDPYTIAPVNGLTEVAKRRFFRKKT